MSPPQPLRVANRTVRLDTGPNEQQPVRASVDIHGVDHLIAAMRFDQGWSTFSQAMSLSELVELHDAIGEALTEIAASTEAKAA